MKARHARAVAVGASAALAYLGGAKVRDVTPVRGTTLLALATVAISAMVSARNTAVTMDTRNRFNDLLENGGHFHGPVTVHADHTVTGHQHVSGDHTVSGRMTGTGGADMYSNINLNSNNANGIDVINNGGQDLTIGRSLVLEHENIYMQGRNVDLQGGSVVAYDGGPRWP